MTKWISYLEKENAVAKNPYADTDELANLLWESEMVADRYSNGGLIFIRTKGGWRAFLGNFKDEVLRTIEKSLDQNVPSFQKGFVEIPRKPSLTDEIMQLLVDCGYTRNYYPEKFRVEIDEDFENLD